MAYESTAFRVKGIEPSGDPAWALAGRDVHREFWREVVRLVLAENEFERARGRDRFGRKLVPISRYTRAHRRSEMGTADPNAPPLTPADDSSRTVAYFDGRAHGDHAEFFWRQGWGRILGYHRAGNARLPVRDVIGIAPQPLRRVTVKMRAWWETRKARLRPPAPVVVEPPEPRPKPKPRPEPKPKPRPRVAAAAPTPRQLRVEVLKSGERPRGRRAPGKILVYDAPRSGPPTIGESTTAGIGPRPGPGPTKPKPTPKAPTRPPVAPAKPAPAAPPAPAPPPQVALPIKPPPHWNKIDPVARENISSAARIVHGEGAKVRILTTRGAVIGRYPDDNDRWTAVYDPDTDTVFLNATAERWLEAREPKLDGVFTAVEDSAHHPAWHELGHRQHWFAIDRDKARFRAMAESGSWSAGDIWAAARVSGYAATSPREFVAETWAGMKQGKRYDGEIMALYQRFGGPPP